MSRPGTVLVLGGVRAGKSAYALRRAAAGGPRVAVVATAEARDPEMARRIERHRRARPPSWLTVEEPLRLPEALARLEGAADTVLVDCLTLWVANLLGQAPEPDEAALAGEAERVAAVAVRRPFELVVVSNEVGWGVHPATPLGRRFRDALGLVNQVVAGVADEVVLLLAGCPLWVKGAPGDASAGRGVS